MRIGYLTSVYPRASDTFVREEVAALRRLGHEVTTYSVRTPPSPEVAAGKVAEEAARTGVLVAAPVPEHLRGLGAALRTPGRLRSAVRLVRALVRPGVRGQLWPWLWLVEAMTLARWLRRDRVTHLHDHISEGSASVAMLAATLAGIPWSMTVHGPEEFDRAEGLALDVKVASAAFTVTITPFARGQLLRWCAPADWDRVHVVRCGVAPEFLAHPPGAPSPEGGLVSVGRLVPQKGHLVLLDALASLAAEGIRLPLRVIGDGPLRSVLQERIVRQGLVGQVRLDGWADAAIVRAALVGARALVVPSFAEGLPVVVMESLALGRPVVATRIAGIPDLVEDGVTGWLVPAGDTEALVAALRKVATSSDAELAALGRAGRLRVAERHDVDQEAAKLAALIAAVPRSRPS